MSPTIDCSGLLPWESFHSVVQEGKPAGSLTEETELSQLSSYSTAPERRGLIARESLEICRDSPSRIQESTEARERTFKRIREISA